MSVNSVDTIELDDNLQLSGVHAISQVSISVHQTFGAPKVQRCARSGGDTLMLIASEQGNEVHGHFTGAQIEALKTLRDIGNPVLLTHHRGSFQVIIPADAMDNLTQVVDYVDPDSDDIYTGTIPFITL